MTSLPKILLVGVPCGVLVAISPWQLWGVEIVALFVWMAWKVTE